MIRRYAKQGGVVVPLNTMSTPQMLGSQGRTLSGATDITDVTVTAHASANTKGNYTQLIASLANDISYLEVLISGTNVNGSDTSMLIDIATGGAGSETVVIANIPAGFKVARGATIAPSSLTIPIKIPAGTRVSARCQSAIGGASVVMTVIPKRSPFDINSSGIDALGVNLSTSNGVELDNATANTKGAWTVISASTPNAYQGLVVATQLASGVISVSANQLAVDVAVGGSGSEVPIVENVIYSTGTAESITQLTSQTFYEADIPAGSRITARLQRVVTNQRVGLILLGVKN